MIPQPSATVMLSRSEASLIPNERCFAAAQHDKHLGLWNGFVVLRASSRIALAAGRAGGLAHNQAAREDMLVHIALDAGQPCEQIQRGAAGHFAQWLADSGERGEGLGGEILVVE